MVRRQLLLLVFISLLAFISFAGIAFSQTPEMPLAIGAHLSAPRRLTYIPPRFDTNARGPVILELVIAPDGTVARARAKSGEPLAAERAIEAAKQWRYQPTVYRKQPAWVLIHVLVRPDQAPSPQETPAAATINVADPDLYRLFIAGQLRDVVPADVHPAPPDRNGASTTTPPRVQLLLERIDLTTPTARTKRSASPACDTISLLVKTNSGAVRKTLLIYADNMVADSDNPRIVYRQGSNLCK